MFNQVKTDTRRSLARKSIRAVFDKKFYNAQEDLASFYQQYFSEGHNNSQMFRFSWLKQCRLMITYNLTSSLLQTLSPEKQKLAEMLYYSEQTQISICNNLFISVSTLNNWDMRLLDMLVDYAILLRITKHDVFYLPRLINMVKALSDLSMLIKRLDQHSSTAIVSPAYVANINQRMTNYRAIITVLNDYKLNSDQGYKPMIVSAKCNNPDATAIEIASVCKVHPTVVGNNLNNFFKEIENFLV